jgi:hypothetical protein
VETLHFSRLARVAEMTGSHPARPLGLGPVFLLAGFCLYWFSYTIADPDLWGHLRFGQDILRTGAIIQNDTYSYRTGGHPWINHEWLSEVIFAGLYNQGGPAGLIVCKVVVSLLLVGLAYGHLARRGLKPFPAALLLILVSIPFRLGLGTIRPQIFTYLLFLIQLLLLERATGAERYHLWALPPVYALWVNLHGGVLAGIGVLAIWVGAEVVARLRIQTSQNNWRLVAFAPLGLLGLCGLALSINPYGPALVEFLLTKGTVPRPEISEWGAMKLTSFAGLLDLGLLMLGTLAVIFTRRPRNPAAIVILCVTAILPLVSQRHYPLFALALVVLAGDHIADVGNHWVGPAWSRFGESRPIRLISVAGGLCLAGLSAPRLGCIRVSAFYFPFPSRAVALLQQSGIRANIAVPFTWGEYVLWHLGPDVKVSIDGRRETAYPDNRYRQSLDFAWGTGDWDALLKPGTTDLALLPSASRTAGLMSTKDGWTPVYQDSFAVLFARAGFEGLARILETPIPHLPDNGDGLCFPNPGPGSRRVFR